MKKLLSMVMAVCILVSCMIPFAVSANSPITVSIDGVTHNFTVAPVIVDGRTLVPAEEFFTAFGASYKYYEDSKTVFAENEDYSVEFVLDALTAKGTRINYDIDVAARMVGDTIMIPVRFAADQMGYKVNWSGTSNMVLLDKINLIRDLPDSEGKKAALARGRQMTEFRFTPLKPLPMDKDGDTPRWFEAGKEYKGVAYSSTEENDKFLGENVLFETYMTALANPDSALYTKDMFDSTNASTYYGMVCNAFVRYCLGIEQRYNTAKWFTIPGMETVHGAQEYTVRDLRLCDVLHKSGHVAMVTGILRDEKGKIQRVEVSESMVPTCRRRIFPLDEFYSLYGDNYRIDRYKYVDSAPALDEENDKALHTDLDKVTPMVTVDYGNKSNYLEGETTVISVFAEGENTVQIICGDKVVEEIPVNGYTKLERQLTKGYYTVKLANTEHFVEFCVCKAEITHTIENGNITVKANSGDPESVITNMEFRVVGSGPMSGILEHFMLTDEEKATGVATRKIPESAGYFKVYFRNKYGIWVNPRFKID